MSALFYTAKRNFVTAGLSVEAIDISILASDDSFNSVAGAFAGLVAGDWILVAGSAVDDGWHELSIDSTSGKITTLSTLTDETAGNLISIIGYKHGNAQAYSLDFESQTLNQSTKSNTKEAESLSGVIETLYFNEITYWDIMTSFVYEINLPYWREFFSSVRGGEGFNFDAYGTVAASDDLIGVILKGDPKITRLNTSNIYTISFKVRKI